MAIEPLKKHTAWIMDRGGKQRIQELVDLESVEWNRVRDDISSARVKVTANKDSAQAEFLSTLAGATGRYELCIWRDNLRVWEGPITLPTFKSKGVEIEARDVMHYGARTIMRAAYDNAYPNTGYVVERARNILVTELARKEALTPPINVVPYIVDHQTLSDAQTSRYTPPYFAYVYEHIDDLAAKAGMDYTVIGRAIHLWDTSKPAMGYTPTVTENDFLGEVYVSVYGMELGTIAAVTDGMGNFGTTGASDPYYGEWERLETAYDEDATAPPTVAELTSQAERNLAGRNPVPLQVRVPDGSSLNMNGVLTIDDLVPGIYVPLLANFNIITISQMQKLQTVRVTETAAGENVQVTFYPASDADVEGS